MTSPDTPPSASPGAPLSAPPQQPPLLRVSHLVRHFDAVKAVDDISFELPRACSVGLIGANGAGKTTAMRIITTQDLPDSGSVEIDGIDLLSEPEKVIARIGWMPDDFETVPHTTIRDFIDYYARSYGLVGRQRISEVDRVIAFCGLSDLEDRRINRLSKGQKQRLCLARTLIGNPDLLVMDEPAAGLDPQARIEFKQLVQQLKSQGKTLLISSHILSELSEMCDSMIFMDEGHIIGRGSQQELENAAASETVGQQIHIELLDDPAALVADLSASPLWKSAAALPPRPGSSLSCVTALFVPAPAREGEAAPASSEVQLSAELRRLAASYSLISFRPHQHTLEETFVNILARRHESA